MGVGRADIAHGSFRMRGQSSNAGSIEVRTADARMSFSHIVAEAGEHIALPFLGHLGKWSVSSYKFGFGPECLRDDDPETFWQYVLAHISFESQPLAIDSSDGPQPHFMTVQFPRKVAIQVRSRYFETGE